MSNYKGQISLKKAKVPVHCEVFTPAQPASLQSSGNRDSGQICIAAVPLIKLLEIWWLRLSGLPLPSLKLRENGQS
jgi:hypothetical protein